MQQRRLGDSDLEVSAIALGSWLTYSGGIGRARTEACTRAAFDAGITFFDTANVYGRGAAERAWGEILADYPRDSFAIATKLYFPMSAKDRGLSREQVHKQIDGSLERLGMDHVDLYQCHRYDDQTPLEETMQALTEVVQAGKARWIGFSEWPVRADRRGPGAARGGEVRLQPAAVLRALARARGRGHPAVRAARDLADRVVAAGPGRAHRQVPPGRGGARGLARRLARHEPLHRAVAQAPGARRRRSPVADRRGGRA